MKLTSVETIFALAGKALSLETHVKASQERMYDLERALNQTLRQIALELNEIDSGQFAEPKQGRIR